jgi:hypothetical protein
MLPSILVCLVQHECLSDLSEKEPLMDLIVIACESLSRLLVVLDDDEVAV